MYKVAELRRLAQAYLEANPKISADALGLEISGGSNNRMITGLLAGRSLTGPSIEKASDFFDRKWPPNAPWPDGIIRNGIVSEKAAAE